MRLACNPATDAAGICWEETTCPLCDGDRVAPLLEAADALASGLRFLIVRCIRCGLCYTNPRPDPDSMSRFYPGDYHCHRGKVRVRTSDPFDRWLPIRTGARLLDFGCGAGGFLLHMRERGWKVVGLDNATAVAERLRCDFGLDVHAGTLPNSLWPDGSFDAITMRQSLEHTHAPREVLHAAHRLLTDGGQLLVSVPNFAGLPAHWFGADWYGLDLPRHLTHFTPMSLQAMLSAAGFKDVALHPESHPSWIRKSAQRRPGTARLLTTRLASGVASRWARLLGKAESMIAVATK